MGRGNATSPPTNQSLPKVEYEVINDDKLKLPGGVHDLQARGFGYNDFSDFRRPDHYVRHIEPLESDLAKTVEYDMDEQDQEWLDVVNAERTKQQLDKVSCESFEIIMDRLEKEWFDLTKNIPKPDFAMPSEDSTCAVCDDSEGENSNAIVFCDGCNLAVHQDCYGVPYIPEGQWLCRKCTVSPEVPVSCDLCPNEGGAFKQTVNGEWVHLLCAIWIPETRVANDVFMEPITGVERISKQRWKLRCSICNQRYGACIQCTKPSCFVAFHATCARKEKLLMPMKSAQGAEPASLKCFCDRHLPEEQQEARAAALALDETRDRNAPATQLASKSARAYAKTYKPGPPLVPAIIVRRISEYISRIKIRKKIEFIQQMSRYWSLKREARRGAPLLKRLHLEPWTANAGTKQLTEEEQLMRLDQLQRLRQDLTKLQVLTNLCRKREIRKLRQAEVIYEVLSEGLFPHYPALRLAFERIMAFDRQDHFKNPVSKQDVPDYFEVIKKPMCWSYIDAKLDQHKYWDLQTFRDDVELVIENALSYNTAGTVFHKTALRIKKEARNVLAELESLKYTHPNVVVKRAEGEDEEDNLPLIGDLEPPLDVLQLLISSDAIKSDLNMELDVDPITSLINYEFAKVKPPPLPSPLIPHPPARVRKPKVQKTKTRPKRDYKAELERARINREAREAAAAEALAALQMGILTTPVQHEEKEHGQETGEGHEGKWESHEQVDAREARRRDREMQAMLDASAGFRAPRTRAAQAEAVHVEEETFITSLASGSAGPFPPSEPSAELGKTVQPLKKRASVAGPSTPSSIPRVVHDVDRRDSFNMFNAGWIFAPDQKRGGRITTERPPLPPPRKRQKTDHPVSRLSVVSTAPSENYTLQRTPQQSSDPQEPKHNVHEPSDGAMDVDVNVEGDRSFESQLGGPESVISHAQSADSSLLVEEPLNVVTQPNGVVIIEKLDTPAIRREKAMRKKAEKEKQRQAARVAGEASAPVSAEGSSSLRNFTFIRYSPPPPPVFSPPPPPPSAPPSSAPPSSAPPSAPLYARPPVSSYQRLPSPYADQSGGYVYDLDAESELSELSSSSAGAPSPPADDVEEPPAIETEERLVAEKEEPPAPDKEPPVTDTAPPVVNKKSPAVDVKEPPPPTPTIEPIAGPSKSKRASRAKKPKKKELFPDGTIVWAKSESFPWWPAVVHADNSPQVPRNILAAAKEKRQKRKVKLYIVQYYDKQNSWQSVPRDKLQELGENKKLDEEMLTSSQKQKWKTSASKQQCREAYRIALAEMDMDGSSNHPTELSVGGEDADGESEN
ncbi:hypothetical protein BDN70DRAFT_358633 [Pholiota conissans]|uniref:Peregrin n=1 Tax=Pholiota conissans TaxID=109636 RepID=A0A9P6CWK7_9AGAR|nr:hypothetical protein BDN70DRAFT_358633 [Pholiota conissans]